MVDFSIADYCRDPSKYKDKFSDARIKACNEKCKNQTSPSNLSQNTISQAGLQFLPNLIRGIFTKNGAIFIGTSIGIKYFNNLVLKNLAKKLENGSIEASASAMKRAYGFSDNSAEVAAAVSETGEATATELGLDAAAISLRSAAGIIDGALFLAGWPLLLTQLTMTLIDAWNPCDINFNTENETTILSKMSDQYNDSFAQIISTPDECTLSGGSSYPLYADAYNFIYPKETYKLQPRWTFYFALYIETLQYNSLGQPIDRNMVYLEDKKILQKQIQRELAGINSVTVNWFKKYIVLIILALGILIFLIVINV